MDGQSLGVEPINKNSLNKKNVMEKIKSLIDLNQLFDITLSAFIIVSGTFLVFLTEVFLLFYY